MTTEQLQLEDAIFAIECKGRIHLLGCPAHPDSIFSATPIRKLNWRETEALGYKITVNSTGTQEG